MGVELKGDTAMSAYLDLLANGGDGVWSVDPNGLFTGDHSYWKGFREGTAGGLRYETLIATPPAPVPLPASVWMLGLAVCGIGALRRRRQI